MEAAPADAHTVRTADRCGIPLVAEALPSYAAAAAGRFCVSVKWQKKTEPYPGAQFFSAI